MNLSYDFNPSVTGETIPESVHEIETTPINVQKEKRNEKGNQENQSSFSFQTTVKESIPPKRRRRKPVKSCAFCRQRKLRCDQRKPICTTCFKRGRKECIYKNNVVEHPSSDSSSGNEILKRKISVLEQRLGITEKDEDGIEPKSKNVLRELNFSQIKENGRRTMFGPTAVRVFFLSERWGLTKKYSQLWAKVKTERKRIKSDTGYSMLHENMLIEEPYRELPPSTEAYTLLSEVQSSLPSYEAILRAIESFFGDDELFIINPAFDRLKVLNDFQESFVPGRISSATFERPICKLVGSSKKNYYKIAVILGIIMYTSRQYETAISYEKFFVMLNGLSTGKTNYVERVQTTFLRYSFRVKWGLTGGDSPHTIMLVNSMVNEATLLGLNTNINQTFEGHETLYGNLTSLRKLWLWIMFCDFDSALQMGSLLKVPDDLVFDETVFAIENDVPKSLYKLMGSFLKIARPMLLSVYSKKVTPDLEQYCDDIISFIEQDFPPIEHYTNEKLISKTNLSSVMILSASISLLLAFYGLRFLALKEKTYYMKNALGTTTIMAFYLSINVIIENYNRDKKAFPESLENDVKYLSPYMCLAVSFLHRLIIRALSIFYTIFYYKLTLFENGLLVLGAEPRDTPIDMTSFRVPSFEKLSFMSVFDEFSIVFDRLARSSDKVFNSLVRRSNILITTFALEKLCHKVMDKVLESRKIAEETWMVQYQNDIDTLAANTASPPTANNTTNIISGTASPKGDNPDGVPSIAAGVENMADSIEDDFWISYNVNWDEFLNSVDDVEFYHELMKRD